MNEAFEIALLAILVRLKCITAEDATDIEKSFHDSDIERFDNFLLEEGLISQEHLLMALAEYYQVPSLDVVGYFFERHYVCMFPKDLLLRFSVIPFDVDEDIMILVAADPNNPELLFELGQYVSYEIQFYVGIGEKICDAVKEFYDKANTQDFDNEDDEQDLLIGNFYISDEDELENSFSFAVADEDRD